MLTQTWRLKFAVQVLLNQSWRFHRSLGTSIVNRTIEDYFGKMTTNVPEPAKRFKEDEISAVVKIGTHDGIFHCDEVLACFMLQQLPRYASAEIIRTRDSKKLDTCDVVVDVGSTFDRDRHRYDHHQGTFNETMRSLRPELNIKRDVRLSSAGLVYAFFGEEVIQHVLKKQLNIEPDNECLLAVYKKIYDKLICEIDGIDNGVPMFEQGEPRYNISTHLSARVGAFNADWTDTAPAPDSLERFEKAKAYVGQEFINTVIYYAKSWWPARDVVAKALANRFALHESGEILELELFCPWKEHLYQLEEEQGVVGKAKYVIYCTREDGWRIICVPVQPASFVCRKFLAKPWRGIRDEDLSMVCGIAGAKFVHQSGFIGGNKTHDGAVQMAIESLASSED